MKMYQIAEDFWRKITPWTEKPDQPQSSLVAQTVKTSLAMGETCVQSLGGEDPLERGYIDLQIFNENTCLKMFTAALFIQYKLQTNQEIKL